MQLMQLFSCLGSAHRRKLLFRDGFERVAGQTERPQCLRADDVLLRDRALCTLPVPTPRAAFPHPSHCPNRAHELPQIKVCHPDLCT